MDKRTIIGIVLIVLVTLLMPFYQKWIGVEKPQQQQKSDLPQDTVANQREMVDTTGVASKESVTELEEKTEEAVPIEDTSESQKGEIDYIQESDEEKTIEIENENIRVILSTADGGNPIYWELKNYKHYKGGNVDLIDKNGMNITFMNADGKEVNLQDYNLYADFPNRKKIFLNRENPETEIQFYLPVRNGRIVKTMRFYRDQYSFELTVEFENLQNYVINRRFFISWNNGLPTTEKNVDDDLNYSRGFAYMAEELEDIDASDEYEEKDLNGRVDWVAVRSKYFLASIIPSTPENTNGTVISGIKKENGNKPPRKYYDVSIDTDYEPRADYSRSFTVYLGPLDYYIVKDYDVDLQAMVMSSGWYERLFRPISLLIIPAFEFLHRFIPNYGLVIILFSILIKLVLHPLTKKSYQSMSEMQYLQPKMTEMREKYKNEPQRLNKEMMKLYKEHGVNPLGGCLPMLLQMPILVALFTVFRSTIQLRGEPFVLWINDLSTPDVLHIGVTLPIIGDNIHVLPIFMALTMVWQSKATMTDPKQKMMVYFMPVFLLFIFYSFPAGLNLYYAIFNVFSMLQTRQIKKKMHPDNGKEKEKQPAVQPVAVKKGKKSRK